MLPVAKEWDSTKGRYILICREVARGRKQQTPQKVTTGRFEIERDGQVASLEYSMSGNVLELIHTDVPDKLRGLGLASLLAENALRWARENNFKVVVICPSVQEYIAKHPEYSDLVLH